MDSSKDVRPVILRLLSGIGSAKEINQYLKRFSQLDAERFAVVKVGGAILRDEIDDLASALAFLQQVGLTPIVVHGAGPQLNDELAAAGVVTPIRDGLRVTSPEALAVVRRVFHAENLKLVEALHAVGARASARLCARCARARRRVACRVKKRRAARRDEENTRRDKTHEIACGSNSCVLYTVRLPASS